MKHAIHVPDMRPLPGESPRLGCLVCTIGSTIAWALILWAVL